jgi:hypothetical protein
VPDSAGFQGIFYSENGGGTRRGELRILHYYKAGKKRILHQIRGERFAQENGKSSTQDGRRKFYTRLEERDPHKKMGESSRRDGTREFYTRSKERILHEMGGENSSRD